MRVTERKQDNISGAFSVCESAVFIWTLLFKAQIGNNCDVIMKLHPSSGSS